MNHIAEHEFINFEKETDIFKIISNNLYTEVAIWDIFRHTVYCKVNDIGMVSDFMNKNMQSKIILWKIKIIFSIIISAIKYLFLPKEALFFYLNLRDIDENGLYFDRNAEDTIKYIREKKILIDSNYNNQYKKNKNAYKTLTRLEPQACKILNLLIKIPYPEKQIQEIMAILKSTKWGNNIDKRFLYNEYKDFYLKYRYYKILFKYLRPKTVFLVQNGIQKSMFLAAKELGIKTVEFQHGETRKYAIAYAYPTITNKVITPNIFLTYGKKWGDILNLRSKIIVIGNNIILPKIKKQKGYELTVISSTINKKRKLDALAIKLSEKYPDLIINFKLHSAELPILYKIKQNFSNYPNIKVITNEIPIDELFSRTGSALMICSTMAYEMLSLGINIYLLKEPDHLIMEQIFNYENVTLVDNAEDMLLKYIVDKDWGKPVSFFEPFHKETIDKIINE